MSGYCSVVVVGNLGKDPEIRATSSGKKVASFSVAVDQGFGDSKRTEWISIIAWDKLAELAEKYLRKGKTVALSGTLQTSSWPDKQTGEKRYRTEVVARDITFMDTRSSEGGQRSNTTQPRQQAAPQTRALAPADPFDNDYPGGDPDGIPF